MRSKSSSTKKILTTQIFLFSIPALILLFLFSVYTLHLQNTAVSEEYRSRLRIYCTTMSEALDHTSSQLNNLTVNSNAFFAFHYADSKLDKHLAGYNLMETLKPLNTQEPLIGGIFLYSHNPDYYLPSWKLNYAREDQLRLWDYLKNYSFDNNEINGWFPFQFSDRTVLLMINGFQDTICAAIIDPSLSAAVTDAEISENDSIFFSSLEGTPFTVLNSASFGDFKWNGKDTRADFSSGSYEFITEPISGADMQLCYMTLRKSVFSQLNLIQKLLLAGLILLILLLPATWIFISRKFLSPLQELTNVMETVSVGNLEVRALENSDIQELKTFSRTLNQMLDNIHDQKVESYEKQIALQQAQLQYLQLQIRPHFYLNCLKGIYSLAQREKYEEIQATVLSLSDYLRYMFQDNLHIVTLSRELESVFSYIKLQDLTSSLHPKLTLDIAATATEFPILPLSLLTFVENSIKHTATLKDLEIHICARFTQIEDTSFLNITITDNGGGFSKEALQRLNHLADENSLYKSSHVGIYNIFYRMELTYNHREMLAFYNMGTTGYVDLFLPVDEKEEMK